jgi:hypothetical protein
MKYNVLVKTYSNFIIYLLKKISIDVSGFPFSKVRIKKIYIREIALLPNFHANVKSVLFSLLKMENHNRQ